MAKMGYVTVFGCGGVGRVEGVWVGGLGQGLLCVCVWVVSLGSLC